MKKIIILIGLVTIAIFLAWPTTKSVISFRHTYSRVLRDEESITIPLMIRGNHEIIDMNNIQTIRIVNDDYVISGTLQEIVSGDEYYYQNDKYVAYYFGLLFDCFEKTIIDNAYFEISTDSNTYSYLIGDFCIAPYFENDISVFEEMAILNTVNGEEKIVGIYLGLENNSINDINVDDIEIISPNIKVELNELSVGESDISMFSSISDYTGNDTLKVPSEGRVHVLIPITYDGFYLNRFGIILSAGDERYVIDDFMFVNEGYFPDQILSTAKVYSID